MVVPRDTRKENLAGPESSLLISLKMELVIFSLLATSNVTLVIWLIIIVYGVLPKLLCDHQLEKSTPFAIKREYFLYYLHVYTQLEYIL